VYLLVDARHGMKNTDVDMMKMLDSCALPYQV
jgi:GTP-binding protein EngB required for normal cell division